MINSKRPERQYAIYLAGLGSRLTHKSGRGLVRVNIRNLKDPESVTIGKMTLPDRMEGVLLQRS